MNSTADGPAQDVSSDESKHSEHSPPSSPQQRTVSSDHESDPAQEERPPPLPPRPNTLRLLDEGEASIRISRPGAPTNLQSRATTAVSLTDIGCHDAGNESHVVRQVSETLRAKASLSHLTSSRGSETADTSSVRSSGPQGDIGDVENVFGDFVATDTGLIRKHSTGLLQFPEFRTDDVEDDFTSEFEPVGDVGEEGEKEEQVLANWKAKRKHYLILSAAGKPIWTRHGDGGLISTYIGVIQTIISFYEGAKAPLSSFSAGDTKFVIVTKGPLYLVAISRMLESDTQLRLQLEALYMQILSTLTLPSLTHLFSVRPSTDLKRPLQGSETLLSTLADSFTRGSPSTLLSALECLKIRKSHRQAINNTLLKTKVSSLLYGLVVAGGRLVNVVRPKKHSLHPGDLQLLFNMIFEAEAVKAGGGESWIPVCLPGFNSSGYLYMYVSFLDLRDEGTTADDTTTKEESVAIVLISADKESFFELQGMRNAFIEQMEKNGSIKIIKEAIDRGRPSPTDIVPGTVIHHFLYKSRANVQFTMSSYDPEFSTVSRRRRLMSTYNNLHASIHAKHTHVKVHHCVSQSSSSFAWVTSLFELYCVAGANANRNALAQSASKIIDWVRQEEERLFIIGGAVF
ncbi:guanine nucleotide exchange factor MON1 [Aspergillus saccharolyticus JOP 1030-1]|uniref:Vacuolar fusion protein MON1 n=1 Tax=Aspergillus saccharolyticus JOP 1030-1 TaxID=1450539 RepID=A0A318ZQ49_9EURO|nr:vacuolar fusion protein mon1 [Aspergillus saccharolyticus JOP 1030-1]PYH46543.1 vacuolar fusion protein mon1 [Aspergillus saccharolyticus JOP 1030-1]